jgi:hypothetical protein
MIENNLKKGVSAVVYDRKGTVYYFLIVHRVKGWNGWEFPKGILEEGEVPDTGVIRVIRDVTGLLKFNVVGMLSKKRTFIYKEKNYEFDTFLAEANMNVTVDISRDEEHDTYIWTTKERVLEKLFWPDEKRYFEEIISALESQR